MSQKTYIIIATLIVVLLLAVWLYLMFFGTPKSPSDIFNEFGPGGEDTGGEIIPPPVDTPVVNVARPRLRQLTTKPVIGFTEAPASTTHPLLVYYAEAGSGNIYTLNPFTTEEEVRISNTTIKEASVASFSSDGMVVAIRSDNDRRTGPLTLGTTNATNNGYDFTTIDKPISDFKVLNQDELVFVTATSTGLLNTVHNLKTQKESTLFTVPFFEGLMQWGTSSVDSHYVYTKPSYLLEGYTYQFTKGGMSRVPVAGYGLMALNTPTHIAYTEIQKYTPKSFLYHKIKDTTVESPLLIIPEKCTASQKDINLIWCAIEATTYPTEFPDKWYRGIVSFKDTIWAINLLTAQASPIVDTLSESGGRELDITNMIIGESEKALYFINKNDNTLWMYEL